MKDTDVELTELSQELMSLDNLDVEELETRLELALGQLMSPGATCDDCCHCKSLVSCGFFCVC